MLHQTQLRDSLIRIGSPRILVIGDIMLDRYSWGSVVRISPEAPIPILRVEREDQRLGGAANAMTNLATLGAQVYACGVVGRDASGECILDLFKKLHIETSGVLQIPQYTTILKHRMISGHTHLLRMDFDPNDPEPLLQEQQIRDYLRGMIPTMDLVVVSDYGKGLLTREILTEITSLGQKHEIPVVGDPRPGADCTLYDHFTLLKPNRKETEQFVGFPLKDKDSILRAARELKGKIALEYLVISLDKDGLFLYQNENHYSFFETEAKEVFDVVGAGDMVVSLLAFMMAGNASIEHAAKWASLAASMAIMYVGVVSFTKEDLLNRMEFGHSSTKIVSLDQLLKHLKYQTQPVVFTNGYFDKITAGVLKFLHQLHVFKGFNVVGLNSDQSLERQKPQPSLLNQQERASLLSAIESVDRIVIFDQDNACRLIETIKPSIVVKGEQFRNQRIPEQTAIESVGARIEYLPEY